MQTIVPQLSEDQFVTSIVHALGQPPRRLRVGIGDDAAAWKARRSHLSLITTDALADGVHFRAAQTSPEALGHKALAVNLSDIAAMGGTPLLAVVALGITEVVDEAWARAFYSGMNKLARSAACAIAGGDIFRAAELTVAVTVVGEVRASNLRLRSGARAGDYACITGPLGLAAGGLRVMQAGVRTVGVQDQKLLRAYETPVPRLLEGRFLGRARAVHALMDISDGLTLDLARMARASQVAACIDLHALVPAAELQRFSDARDLMLDGGDDYELLAAVEVRAYTHLARRYRARFKRDLQVIGRFEPGKGELFALQDGQRVAWTARGYDHFSALQRAHPAVR